MIDVELKDVSPRLTVGPDRAVLKVPPGTEPEKTSRLTNACAQIVDSLRSQSLTTCRGKFRFRNEGFGISPTTGTKNRLIGEYTFDQFGKLLRFRPAGERIDIGPGNP